jgi:hypothetical protein
MKKSIKWHKEVLEKSKSYAKEQREIAKRKMAEVEKLEQGNLLKQAQIELAIKEGKDGFDEDKYAVKRLCV